MFAVRCAHACGVAGSERAASVTLFRGGGARRPREDGPLSAMFVGVRATRWLVMGGLLGGALWACSSEGGSGKQAGALAELGIVDGAEKGLTNRVEVDGTSDVKVPLRTGAEIQIPKGAVADRVTIGIERPADEKALGLIEKLARPDRVLSAPYVLTPHGTKFLRDVTVTLPIAKMGDRNVQVAYLEDEKDTDWEIIGVPKGSGKQASIEIGHFSVLVLIDADGDELEAGTERDAGGNEADTGADPGLDGGVAPDASATADANVDIDGRVIDASVEPGLPTLYERYVDCGFATEGGMYVDRDPPEGPWEHCRRTCLLTTATCLDLQQYQCYHGDYSPSPALAACELECAPVFSCADPEYTGYRCNGYSECPNGEDEMGCDPALQFVCPSGGGTISVTSRCDGYNDCENGEDEAGCRTFTCPFSGGVIPYSRVCDGNMDCQDTQNPQLNDEPSNCVQYECSIITQ